MKGIITIVLLTTALVLSTSIISTAMSLVQAQNETQPQQPQTPLPPPQTILPSPPVPAPPTGIAPPPPEQLTHIEKMPDNLFQQCMALHNGQVPPPDVFSANSKKIPAPYGTQLPLCALFPQFSQLPTNMSNTLPPIKTLPPGTVPPELISPPLTPPSQPMRNLSNLPLVGLPPGAIILKHLPPGIPPPPPPTLTPADLRESQAGIQYIGNMQKEIQTRLGNDTSVAHLAQVLKQMTAEGKITCHPPFTSMVGCGFAPRILTYQPIPGGGPIVTWFGFSPPRSTLFHPIPIGPTVSGFPPSFPLSHNLTK